MVEVEWFGHACFMMRDGPKTVIFDPFKGVGLPEPKTKADVILCSHGHSDHNNAKAVSHEKSTVIEGFTGTREIDGMSVRGVAAFHDDSEGSKRGRNSVYVVRMDDIAFCHAGDLGHTLSESQIDEIGPVDVLFLPVGGFFTIGPKEAREVMESLRARITVPMHYRAPGMSSTFRLLKKADDFIGADDNVQRLDGPTFTVRKGDLPESTTIIMPKLH